MCDHMEGLLRLLTGGGAHIAARIWFFVRYRRGVQTRGSGFLFYPERYLILNQKSSILAVFSPTA